MNIPVLGKFLKPKEKRKIENEIKELNKRKARLKTDLIELDDLERDDSEVKEEIRDIEKQIKEKYDELANIEYREALKDFEEESEEKRVSLTRMKAELKEQKKENKRLKERIKNTEEKIESLKEDKKEMAKTINKMERKLRDRELRIEQYEDIIKEKELEKDSEEESFEEYSCERTDLLEYMLEEYSDYINSKEKRTIQEMKSLIQPNNINLREFLEDIDEEETLEACEDAYEKIMDEVKSCPNPPVEHWMNLKAILDIGAADYDDKAILLCSAFLHLGAEASIVKAELQEGEEIPLVEIKVNEKYIYVDPNEEHTFKKYYGTREEIKKQFKHNGKKIKDYLYCFNDKKYRSMEE